MDNKKIDNKITKGTGLFDHYIFRKIIIILFKYFNFKNIHPNFIVLINFFLVLFSFFLIIKKEFILGLVGLLIYFMFYDLFDLLDGAIARYYNKTSIFGGFFDSFIDFLSEIFILFVIGIYFNKINLIFYLIFFILFVVFFSNKIRFDFKIKERQLNILELKKKTILDKIKYTLIILTRNDFRKLFLLTGFILNSFYFILFYFSFLYFLVLLNNLVFLMRNYRK